MKPLNKVGLLLLVCFLFGSAMPLRAADPMSAQTQQKTEEEKEAEFKEKMEQLERHMNSARQAEKLSPLANLKTLPRLPQAVAAVPQTAGAAVPVSVPVNASKES